MTNLVNFERDMFWTDAAASVGFLNSDLAFASIGVNNAGTVGQRHSVVQGTATNFAAGTGVQAASVGCLILPPPDGDNVPYRFKGAVVDRVGNPVVWSFGYLAGGVGTGVEQSRVVACGSVCDEIVVVRPLDSADPNYGDPLCFYGSVLRVAASDVKGGLSVQRLIAKPDQFAAAVS